LACVAGVAVAAAPSPANGKFSGHTSQRGRYYVIRFRVHGSRIEGQHLVWGASCKSGRTLRAALNQGKTRISIHHGAWSAPGSYSANIKGSYTGHFQVVENRGRFSSTDRAAGSFRMRVRVYRSGHPYDRCDTGVIHWTASHT
jgi:hypothetical protein